MPYTLDNDYRDPNHQQSAGLTARGAAAAVDDLYEILKEMTRVRFDTRLSNDTSIVEEARRLKPMRERVNAIRAAMRKYPQARAADEASPYVAVADTMEQSISASWREILERAQRALMREAGLTR